MKKFVVSTLIALLLLTVCFMPQGSTTPANAAAAAPAGAAVQFASAGRDLVRADILHFAKPVGPDKGKTDPGYKLMGVKWPDSKLPISFVFNPNNAPSGSLEILMDSMIIWDDASSVNLFSGIAGVDNSAKYGDLNGTNAIAFGPYSNSGVIAVTSVWYTRATRQIVEFDMLFNTYFDWGNADHDATVMDVMNIAVHELGHAFGLSDIYKDTFNYVSMYGYATEGETIKRDLAQPDISGIFKIYG